jgi:HD-GYP domain-containing protein (c-di-GMP phosphodiesterase class II)/DNA-binding CsgD family transcriptional regulator
MATIRLAELVGRLSLPFEAGTDARLGGAVRAAVLGVELGRRAGANTDELRDVYWLALAGPRERGMRWQEALRQVFSREAGAEDSPPAMLAALDRAVERDGAFRWREQADVHAVDDPRIFERFLELEPEPVELADERRFDRFALAVAIFIDLEHPTFCGHSTRVAEVAAGAAAALGLGAGETRTLRLAALLHDVGRTSVPRGIWTRPSALDWADWERVRLQPFHTGRVLAPIAALAEVAEVATAVEERLNGSGYPHGRSARAISLQGRVLAAAHMAVAMGEDRPHRGALGSHAVARELVEQAAAGRLDPKAVDAVLSVLGMPERSGAPNLHGLSARELEVSRLLALGKSDKEIGAVLHISPRTVQVHVARILDKLGVRSRSGAAVWLVQHDLAS